ncbi:DUF3306 domain-containing protein [Polynucleobacter sp. HIN5]|uniref:DUF3306 domain-containing protein n=1 Tax=Polynucleobacter sp. HIN5 TaxID=3047864 RepID=UPI002573FFAD|nr:DUF3306 domain-containing protein [Polynucleobacter sp. HIN5]BEI33277.1 DUF3306 domain-containing protein [Polynucleobacter sp. HIN5]
MAENNFLSRWSRKKAGLTEETTSAPSTAPIAKVPEPLLEEANQATSAPDLVQQPPPPTIEDVEKIDVKAPDFSAFMRPDVDPLVQQAALKKMFSDPHFNVMDGLDIYIDDYTKSDPIPLDMLKRMQQSELLGLFKSAEELYPESKEGGLDQADAIQTSAEEPAQIEQSSQAAPMVNQDAAQPIDIESEALNPKVVDEKPSGERQAKRDSDSSGS